jgi:hypothetical protein
VIGVVRIVAVVAQLRLERAVADLDRVRPSGDLEDRYGPADRRFEVRGEPLRLDGGGGDEHLEVGSAGQQPAQVA